MTGRTEIINRALVKIGAQTISDPNEESEQARKANMVFPSLARGELRRQVWSFAKKRAVLPLVATPPGTPDFTAGHNLPNDCLRLITLNGNWVFNSIREGFSGGDPAFSIEGTTLVSNDTGAAYITYVADLGDDTSLWDANFVEAFACRLAAELTPSLTKNQSLKQALKQEYVEALKEAKRVNAIELPPQALADDSWLLTRYY